jgi:hypothetical protein
MSGLGSLDASSTGPAVSPPQKAVNVCGGRRVSRPRLCIFKG